MKPPPLIDDPRLTRLLDALPQPARHAFTWLMRPRARWLRLPLGAALIAGGVFSFLPVLGLWMLPIGGLLLGEDIPLVRRVTLHALGKAQQWWDGWVRRRRRRETRG